MQKLNKDLASYLLEFIDFTRYGKFIDILYPGSYSQFYNKNLKVLNLGDYTGYYIFENLHRENDQPAVEWSNGTKYWYKNGIKHRLNGPAIEWSNGSKYWYKNGKLHRENDQPVIECSDGTKIWYQNGGLCRILNRR